MKSPIFLAATATLLSLTLAGCAPASSNNNDPSSAASNSSLVEQTSSAMPSSTDSPAALPKPTSAPSKATGTSTVSSTEKQLVYLIEEEKLAHDVYSAMFDLWGSQVFGNILKSETNHQGQVLALLEARNIADPRASEAGVFQNTELQALYDQLIAKGEKSAADAYEVGIAIEELDIEDITVMLSSAKDADVIATLENLRKGSENHLRAFNRQF